MGGGIAATPSDMKRLAIIMYDFLIEEHEREDISHRAKVMIGAATDLLGKAYKIRLTDYVFSKLQYTLSDLCVLGFKPVSVKSRVLAEQRKRKGNEYMDTRMYKLAEIEYTTATELNRGNAVYFCNRAVSKIRQGSLVPAVEDCNKALELDPEYVNAYSWLGLVHARMDHPGRAVRCYRKALDIEPNNAVCRANLDTINRRLNRVSFKVLQPLHRGSRNFFRVESVQNLPGMEQDSEVAGQQEMQKNCLNSENFIMGVLD